VHRKKRQAKLSLISISKCEKKDLYSRNRKDKKGFPNGAESGF
jgi:hypothetical protein